MSSRARVELSREFSRWGWDEKGWAPRTREKYAQRVKVADEWLLLNRGTPLAFATTKDLQAYLFSTSPDARNRNNVRQALVGFGDFLVEKGFTQVNAARGLPRLPEPQSQPKPLSHEQAVRIACILKLLRPMERTLAAVFLYTGMRKTEVRLLEWRHLDESYGYAQFSGKGSKERTVPIHPELAPILQRWRTQCPDPRWVFPSPRLNGKPVSDTWVRHAMYEVGDAAGIARLHPHQCRHTWATEMLEAGADVRDVQQGLGHADLRNTQIYTLVRPARLREAIERLSFQIQEVDA